MTMFSVPNNCCHPSWASFAQITTANPKPRQFALRHGASSLDLDRTNSGWKTHRLVGTPTGKELRSIPVYCIKPGNTWTICCSQYSSPWCLPKSCPSSIPISTLTSNNCLNPIGHSQISDTTALPCQMKIAQHRWSAHKLLTSKWLQFAPPILLLTSPHHDALAIRSCKAWHRCTKVTSSSDRFFILNRSGLPRYVSKSWNCASCPLTPSLTSRSSWRAASRNDACETATAGVSASNADTSSSTNSECPFVSHRCLIPMAEPKFLKPIRSPVLPSNCNGLSRSLNCSSCEARLMQASRTPRISPTPSRP